MKHCRWGLLWSERFGNLSRVIQLVLEYRFEPALLPKSKLVPLCLRGWRSCLLPRKRKCCVHINPIPPILTSLIASNKKHLAHNTQFSPCSHLGVILQRLSHHLKSPALLGDTVWTPQTHWVPPTLPLPVQSPHTRWSVAAVISSWHESIPEPSPSLRLARPCLSQLYSCFLLVLCPPPFATLETYQF